MVVTQKLQRLAGGAMMWNRASAAATTVAEPVVQARPPETAKDSATTESGFAVSPGEAGSPRSRASDTTCTAEMTAVAKSVAEVRPFGVAKHSATSESVFAESSGDAGKVSASWNRRAGGSVQGTAEMTAVAKSVAEAGPSWDPEQVVERSTAEMSADADVCLVKLGLARSGLREGPRSNARKTSWKSQ